MSMRPPVLTFLFQTLDTLPGVGAKLVKRFQALCGTTVADLLWHLPVHVNERPLLQKVSPDLSGSFGTVCMEIDAHIPPATRRQPYRILGTVGQSPTELVFFNYHGTYLTEQLPIGQIRWVSGRLNWQAGTLKILHPDYISPRFETIPVHEVIYPLVAGLTNKMVARVIHTVLKSVPNLPEWLDLAFQKQQGFVSWKEALLAAHYPRTQGDLSLLSAPRKRLAYDELLANQLALLLARAKMKRGRGFPVAGDGHLRRALLALLPFELTGAQQRVLTEIAADSASETKMLRLLQGDVGSGKTIVALLSLLNAVEAGYQGVLMAPTDILAHQHFATFEKLCAPLNVRVGLLSGREKGKKRRQILSDLQEGKINILIGTHAVFVEDVSYHQLGLVVIDEQHKFGVSQRLMLTAKQPGVDLLVMTATPIPRTLALTNYGDMDMSKLDEKPAQRKPIETRVLSSAKMDELIEKIHAMTTDSAKKTQVYWVCPLVEESEKSDLTAAIGRFKALKQVFHERVGLVHGKMKGAEKDAVMADFAAGRLDVLVSTTVIEVGVDVPSAGVMVIEHAERFGLSQLHQLRGRIGRGGDSSTCLLVYAGRLSDTARKRLEVMRTTTDGFVIAEEDLKLRGAGEVLGSRQSGFLEFKMADLSVHGDLLWTATQDARMILSLDRDLQTPRGQALRTLLYLFKKDVEIQTLKSG